jgi:hypothetical protein
LTRDYTTIQSTYDELLKKRENAKLAADLERRNIGQQFKVLDPAKVPEQPYSPNKYVVVGGGFGGGLVLGLLVVVLLEYTNSSFSREEEVTRLCQVPVLAIIPTLTTVEEREKSRKRRRFAWVGATVVGLVGSAVALAVWQLRP